MPTPRPAPALLLALALLAGCLERTEVLTVHPDGAIDVVHTVRGGKSDLEGGAAAVPAAPVFSTERTVERKENGDEEHVLTARAHFASAADLPERFIPAADPLAAAALSFTTRVTTRQDGKKTIYRFERTYAPRIWAPYAYFHRRAFPDELDRRIEAGDDLEDFNEEERQAIVRALIEEETRRIRYWGDEALSAVGAGIETRLDVHDRLTRYCAEKLPPATVRAMLESESADADQFAFDLRRGADQIVLQHAGLSGDRLEALRHALALQHRAYDVTDDLGDENFVVKLALPGKVTGHNGDEREGDLVVWRFHGKDLRDRTHVLLATSVVERE